MEENGKRKLCSKCNPHLVERKIKVPVVCIIGESGSGKGIQCDKIVMKYGFEPIIAEYLVSSEYKARTRSKLFVTADDDEVITDGKLTEALKTEMFKHLNSAKGFAIDTFPNNIAQAKLFESGIAPIDYIFFLDAPADVLTRRTIKKQKTVSRIGTATSFIAKKSPVFVVRAPQLMQHYGDKYVTINGNRSPEDVFEDIRKYLEPLVE
ncbi:hypothetical protein QE152_g35025 [Popillia japonica]|uniref:Adenylate kinase n=1 Tax=Popillia japonica TaxID=7064 RepID=A0AAW1ISX2_POPJA